jgi:hypothetical protein
MSGCQKRRGVACRTDNPVCRFQDDGQSCPSYDSDFAKLVSQFGDGAAILKSFWRERTENLSFAAEPDSRAAVAFIGVVSMADIKIEVWDATGNKRQVVEVPADAEVNRLIAVLIERMNLPRNSPDGQMMSYKFHHKSSGRQLLDTETLAAANVKDGDILRLQPEITAGGS